MNSKTLMITLAAAAVVTAIGVGINQSGQGQSDFGSDQLLPELGAAAQSIDSIKIESAGNQLIVQSHKQDNQWVIDNLDNYVADTAQLSTMVNALKDARKVEAKTAKPDNFHHLGLRDITDSESQAVLVSVSGGGKSWQLLIGKPAKNGSGQYVRLAGDNQTWLIDKAISKPDKAEDWINDKLFDFTVDDIQSVALSGKFDYVLSKADKEAGNFALGSLPEGHKLKYDSITGSVPRSVANLRFDAIKPTGDWTTPTESQSITVSLFAEQEATAKSVQMTVAKQGEQYLAKLSGDNPLWLDWVYQISEYNYSQLVKDPMDYLDPIEPAEEAAPTPVLTDGGGQ